MAHSNLPFASPPPDSPDQKPNTFATSEMLTPSERESLLQDAKEASDYLRKVFSGELPMPEREK